MSGMAPGAWLGNYNVFPGEVVDARSEDILNAVEAAVLDGMDVINLSLGGGYHGNNDLLAKGLDTAVAAGVVVVASGGQRAARPGSPIGSPGRARDIITVGASAPISTSSASPSPTAARTGRGTARRRDRRLRSAARRHVRICSMRHRTGAPRCPPAPPARSCSSTAAMCTFSVKVANAKAAGAKGVIIVNNVVGDPTATGRTAGFDDDIPAVMISKADGAALRASGATSVTISGRLQEFITENGDILAGFSSQGPTFVNYAVKPDLTSVGVNVLSSIVCSGPVCGDDGDWAFYNGTSMAAPHVTGSAAVLLDLHPDWTPAQVKSALVNTADPVVKNAFDATTIVGPQLQGSGREDLTEAFQADVTFSPVSASYGRISASRTKSTPLTITVRNLTGSTRTFDVAEQRFDLAAGTLGSVVRRGNARRRGQPDLVARHPHGAGQRDGHAHAQREGRPPPRDPAPGLDHADRRRRHVPARVLGAGRPLAPQHTPPPRDPGLGRGPCMPGRTRDDREWCDAGHARAQLGGARRPRRPPGGADRAATSTSCSRSRAAASCPPGCSRTGSTCARSSSSAPSSTGRRAAPMTGR